MKKKMSKKDFWMSVFEETEWLEQHGYKITKTVFHSWDKVTIEFEKDGVEWSETLKRK